MPYLHLHKPLLQSSSTRDSRVICHHFSRHPPSFRLDNPPKLSSALLHSYPTLQMTSDSCTPPPPPLLIMEWWGSCPSPPLNRNESRKLNLLRCRRLVGFFLQKYLFDLMSIVECESIGNRSHPLRCIFGVGFKV